MKKVFFTFIITLLILFSTTQTTLSNESTKTNWANDNLSNVQVTKNLASIPLTFTENQGQWDDKVKFRANTGGATMWFASDGTYYQFTRTIESDPISIVDKRYGLAPNKGALQTPSSAANSIESIMIKANFVGANQNPQMVGVDMMEYKCNYFIGNDKSKWAIDVPNYQAVVYKEIYDGIDLKYYGNGTQMEYDFNVSPGADFSQIKIKYEGAESIVVNDNGELVVTTMWGEIVEQRPVIYQIENNNRIPVDGKYNILSDNSFSFDLSNYNSTLSLVIDPILSYSTFLGGSVDDRGYDIAVDAFGAAYVTGELRSTDFPVFNSYQGTFQGASDAFVTKLSSSGNSLIYSTYLGGDGWDDGSEIVVDVSGAAYVTGNTSSNNFPTSNPYQATKNGSWDTFVTKLSSAGNSLIYSTYLGGTEDNEVVTGIAVDNLGAAYITGNTSSTVFPTNNPYQGTLQGLEDVFVSKLSSAGSSLVYSTYLGGSDNDYGINIAVDAYGAAFVIGYTSSTDFPTANAYQATFQGGSVDVFVTKLNSSGSSLDYSTFLGGANSEYGNDIAVDAFGAAYVTGHTSSTDFPMLNSYQGTNLGYADIFITKLSNTGNSLVYSTYLGGATGYDYAYNIAVDISGAAYIAGNTSSSDFPTINSYPGGHQGYEDVVVAKLSSTGNKLIYSTYFGSSDYDYCNGIAVDSSGAVYVTGYTSSTNYPTYYPYQGTFQGVRDAFVTKFEAYLEIYEEVVNPGSNVLAFGSNGQTITFDSVETTGTVTVEYSPIGPGVGTNLSVLPIPSPIFYNVSTTAGFVGNFEICFSYDPSNITSEDSVKIYHYDSTGNWVDITTSLDTASNTVCGITDHFSPFVVLVPDIALSVEFIDSPNLPDNFSLSQNYPNPFNPTTTIEFSLPTKSDVTVTIYNLLGQKVNQLVNQDLSAGSYQVTWDGTSSNGVKTSTGIYFYRIVTENFVEAKKMLLLK